MSLLSIKRFHISSAKLLEMAFRKRFQTNLLSISTKRLGFHVTSYVAVGVRMREETEMEVMEVVAIMCSFVYFARSSTT